MSSGRIQLGVIVASLAFASVAVAQQATQQLGERQREQSGLQNQTERIDAPSQTIRRPGEQPAAEQRTAGYRAGGQAGQRQELDKYLATCLLIKNQAEIEMNQFGQQHAQNPQVKQFAQQMVQDHQQLAHKLEQIAGQQANAPANRQTVGATGQSGTERTATNTQPAAPAGADRAAAGTAGGGDTLQQLASIDREITQRCGEMMKEKLQEKQGAEFDRAFVGCQIGAHVGMLAALQVIQQRSTGELAQVAQQAEQSVQKHLEHAEQLMKQVDSRQARADQ